MAPLARRIRATSLCSARFSDSNPPSLCLAALRSCDRPSRSALSLFSRSRSLKIHLLSVVTSRSANAVSNGLWFVEPGVVTVWLDALRVIVDVRSPLRGFRSRSRGPVGMDGEGLPLIGSAAAALGSLLAEYAARLLTSCAVRSVAFSTLSWRYASSSRAILACS